MKPRFRITPPSGITPTKMRIYRASKKVDVGSAAAIFDGNYSATYTDTAVTVVGENWYRVFLSSDGTNYFPMPLFSVNYVDNFGPCTNSLPAAFASVFNVNQRGCGRAGVLLKDTALVPIPTQSIVTNWPTLVSNACGVTGSPAPSTTATYWEVVTIDGVIYVMPVDTESLFRIGSGSVTAANAETYINQLYASLADPIFNTANQYTFNGFTYRLEMLNQTQAQAIGPSWLVDPVEAIQYQASSVSRTLTYFPSDTANQALNLGNTGTSMTYSRPSGTLTALYPLVAFRVLL